MSGNPQGASERLSLKRPIGRRGPAAPSGVGEPAATEEGVVQRTEVSDDGRGYRGSGGSAASPHWPPQCIDGSPVRRLLRPFIANMFPAGDFSVEAPDGVRILMRSRLFTDSESKQLEATKTPV
jgi:hypothetical protein